jgi:trigger factor
MKSDLVVVSETKKNLVIEIPSEEVDLEIQRITREYGRAARIPGFRPGKVPAGVVKQRFKEQILHEAGHELVERAVNDALRTHDVQPIEAPDVPHVHVKEGEALSFTATVETAPAVDPGDYGEIQLRRHPATVESEAVDKALEALRERAARYEPVEDRGAEAGDTVVMDLQRRSLAEGAPAEPEKHENVSVELGADANPPGFDAELSGMRPDEEKTFTVAYPADHSVKELAGTSIEYAVKIRAIRRKVLPPLDDDLAKEVSDVDTLDKLRERVRESMVRQAANEAERALRNDLLKALASRVTAEVPAVLVERDLDRRLQDFVSHLLQEGVDPRKAGLDWANFREEQRPFAVDAVKATLMLDEVAKREQIQVSDEELDRDVESYARRSGRPVPDVRAQLEKDGDLERVRMSRVTIAGE